MSIKNIYILRGSGRVGVGLGVVGDVGYGGVNQE